MIQNILIYFIFLGLLHAEEAILNETFDHLNKSSFITKLPNKNTTIENGVMWTRGESGRKYPPMVYMPLSHKDIVIEFKYRHLEEGGFLYLFIDGDDGFGGTDHILRLKLNRNNLRIQVDGHSLDPNATGRQTKRAADPKSGAYRLNERFPLDTNVIPTGVWQNLKIIFKGEQVTFQLNKDQWTKTLKRVGFKHEKRKLLFMQDGGEKGIEIDDVFVTHSK